MEEDRVPKRRPKQVTRKRRRTASLCAGEYRQWRKARDFLLQVLLLLCLTCCLMKLFVVRRKRLEERLGRDNPAVRELYQKVVLVRRFAVRLMVLMLVAFQVEQRLGTMSAAEAHSRLYARPQRWTRIAEFYDDNESFQMTGHDRAELHKLLELFDLPPTVYVYRNADCHGRQRRETFHREELLVYCLMKFKSGSTHAYMADAVTFGCDKRWSRGYRWFMSYVARRYEHLIGPRGIERWVRLFPQFAEAIRQKISSTFWKWDEDNGVWIDEGFVWFAPGDFNVVGFADCSSLATNQPGRGPSGSFPGAPRRRNWYIKQRAFFNGWNHMHGVKVITFNLPNGLVGGSYGPVSNRRNDRVVVEWSDIDDDLAELQDVMMQEDNTWPGYFCFFADQGFFAAHWKCLRTKHKATENAPLTGRQEEENDYTNRVRESIEWGYGETKMKWKELCQRYHHFPDRDLDLICNQVKVGLLLTNIFTCMRGGNIVSEYFDFDPPTVEEYLVPN